ncbi:hypothetical protein [Sporosarcina sp. YIM B06819]|uniref:hypothetical protein n=1 Tax=Sporosarcina sp. YIM B06819 TaxID=3081769 RepID=UPI00298C8443|nr:hypothetical protein [Sporosarcina sp. YIM B06819]
MNFTHFTGGCCGGGHHHHAGGHHVRIHPGVCHHHDGHHHVGFYPGMFRHSGSQHAISDFRFSSGHTPVVLTSLANGVVGAASIIGCRTAVAGVIGADGNIILPCSAKVAQCVRKAGEITAITAYFTVTTPLDVAGQDETVTATIYRAPAGSNVFSPTTASVDLAPVLTSLLPAGTTLTGTKLIVPPVAVAAGDRLIMVYTMSGSAGDVAAMVTGAASASVTIVGGCGC